MQQRQEALTHRARRGSFPWWRVVLMFAFFLLLSGLVVIGLLATGHVIDTVWSFVVTAALGLIGAMVPVLQWLFPVNPLGSSQSELLPDLPTPVPQATPVKGSFLPVSSVSPALTIFHFDERELPGPDEFYARAAERIELIDRISKRSSAAIVGEYRMGKSWLMQYLQQIAPTHPQLGPQVRIARLSATHPQCATVVGFVRRALEVLELPGHKTALTPLLRLSSAAREFKNLGIIPVLCIDEFAGLTGKPGFDKDFVAGLRAIAEDEGLVLITASRQPLHQLIKHMLGEDSPLFNIMPEFTLHAFTEQEAREFVSSKAQQASLDGDEQAFLLECGAVNQPNGRSGWPPLRLQLAGRFLLADKYPAAAGQPVYKLVDPAYQANFRVRLDERYNSIMRQP